MAIVENVKDASCENEDLNSENETGVDRQIDENNNVSRNRPNEAVKLILYDTEGNQIEYEVKRHVPLGKLLEAYCKAKGKNIKSLYMSIGGVFVNVDKCANDLDLDDGSIIQVVSRQDGGCIFL